MMKPVDGGAITWSGIQAVPVQQFQCGHCGLVVASDRGWTGQFTLKNSNHPARLLICPHCTEPSYLVEDKRLPGAVFGSPVHSLPDDVNGIYEEARNCMAISAYTAAAHLLRKLLMNIAVSKGAATGEHFVSYIEFLNSKGYIPPDGKEWVDHIRKMGNEAAHEIRTITKDTAQTLITFSQMLLTFVYDFPARVPVATN